MPKQYSTFMRMGKEVKRRRLTQQQKKVRAKKFRASMLWRKLERTAKKKGMKVKHGGNGAAGASHAARNVAQRAALDEFAASAGNIPPKHHRARANGHAYPRVPDVTSALIHLDRCERWILEARFMGVLREMDPAHREAIAARGALLGLSAPEGGLPPRPGE